MSFAIIRMQKFKGHDVKGIQIHNQREKESRTNPDIKKDRMILNYDLLNDRKIDFSQRIQQEINERYTGGKTIRKDAVKLCEFVVTSDKEFFDELDPEDEQRFFKASLKFLQERYGKENILYAIVHKDEKTPHMHVGMVPITQDGKLAAKQFFGKRTELQQLQDKFHQHVVKAGFDIDRGVASDAKHIEMKRFKVLTADEELKNLKYELEEKQEQKKELDLSIKEIEDRLSDLGKSLDHVKQVDKIEVKEKGGLLRSKTVELAQEDFDNIKTLAKLSEGLKIEFERSERENNELRSENDSLKKENDMLAKENTFLKVVLEGMKAFCKDQIHNFSKTLGIIKAHALEKMGEKLLKKYFVDDEEREGAQIFFQQKE
ncbi:MobV family relaxase, partial [Metabacillus fastidiosus]|uniref:MobV family relaxase n=1 Tax=Metabacillus fastidiosus TaxID=1458 RepID=UPI003D27CB5B